MPAFRHHILLAARIPILALCLGLLTACSGVGGSQIIIPEGCVVTAADLQGTWIISHVPENLVCPPGEELRTTTATNRFTPVTVVRDEALPGFMITGTGLTATVLDVSCHIVWTYLDHDTNALFDCYTTFDPDTRMAGGTTEAGHCSQITLINPDGTTGAPCPIPAPYLDSFIVVEGS